LPPGHAEEILTWLNHWKAAAVTYRSLTHVAVLDLEEQLADELVTCFSPNLRLHVVKSFIAYNGLWAVEFTGAGVTKATAATKLIHMMGMMGTKPSRVIAAGDSYNDLPLLRMCGLRIAMGNAPTELKAIADYIAPPVEEDGLAVAIEEFVVPRLQSDTQHSTPTFEELKTQAGDNNSNRRQMRVDNTDPHG
jgi:hydroxymethylpyrimidine pyrophosphatase-like HAD family hydrolase